MPCLVLAIGENDLECHPDQRLLEYVRLIKRYHRGMWKERRNKACQKKLNVIRFSYLQATRPTTPQPSTETHIDCL
jgi:hypothetical protein